jgi:plastocyanin
MERPQRQSVRTCEEVNAAMKEKSEILTWCTRGVAVAILTMLTGTGSMAAAPLTVDIKGFTFTPPAVTVPIGTTVTWVNHDEETHTVTLAKSAFGSAGLMNNETFTQTFTKPGTYEYFCRLHPYTKATVVVK